jgi:Protein of unknown function (DUF4012)
VSAQPSAVRAEPSVGAPSPDSGVRRRVEGSHGSRGSRGGSHGRRRSSRRRRWLWPAGLGLLLLVVAFVAVVADAYYQSYRVYQQLRQIQPKLAAARQSLSKGRIPTGDPFAQASGIAAQAQTDLDRARPTLGLAAAIPFVNRPIVAVRRATEAAGEESQAATIVRDIVRDLLGDSALGGRGRGAPVFRNGRVDVALLGTLAPRLSELIRHLKAGDRAIRAIPSVPFTSRVEDLKAEALQESTRAIALARRGLAVIRLVPSFLGAQGDRTYFLALQQNAALRGTGGSVLAYAILRVSDGAMTLERFGPIAEIDGNRAGVPVRLDPRVAWYTRNAGVRSRIANGVDYSPDFPLAAATWQAQVQKSTGIRVDGAIALDPFAVAAVLRGSPPIRVSALPTPVTARNVVSVVENEQFRLSHAQQVILPGQLIQRSFRLITDPPDVVKLLNDLGSAMSQKRVQIWSADPAQERFLRDLGWGGSLRRGTGDYLNLVQNNRLSNKIDYYAHQSVLYTVRIRDDGSASSTCTVTLRNAVPATEQDVGIAGPSPYTGWTRAMMNLYVPKGATFVGVDPADVGGPLVEKVKPPGFVQHVEGPFRVLTQTMAADAGQTARLTFRYTVPGVVQRTARGRVYRINVQHQPLVNPAELTIRVILPKDAGTVDSPGWIARGGTASYSTILTRDFTAELAF